MPLRQFIRNSPETLSDMLLAADDRYLEGEELLLAQRFDGCVYLFGYAAEMWLKAACLRLRGNGPASPVKAGLPALRAWMKGVAPHVLFTDYHDLAFLAACVRTLRDGAGRPLPSDLATELQDRVMAGLHERWVVDMRYRRSALAAADAWAALLDTWWVKNNWPCLV